MSILSVAASGLLAFNRAQQMTAHNIANVHTEGFIKSRANFRELPSVGTPPIGSGVAFDSTLADEFLKHIDNSIYDKTGDVGYQQGLKDALGLIPEDGVTNIAGKLADFHNAAQALADDPENLAVKTEFLDRARQFAGSVNEFQSMLGNIQSSIDQTVEDAITQVNYLTSSIANQLRQGENPRADIEELSTYIGVNYNNGQLITDNGLVLVDGNQARELTAGSVTKGIGGYLGGISEVANDTIPGIATMVHGVTSDYMDRVNNEYYNGTYLTLFGREGDSFTVVPNSPFMIRAGADTDDNSNALAIVNLIDQTGLTGASVKTGYLQTDLTLHNKLNQNTGTLEREAFMLEKLVDDRDAKYGVDLDQEAVNMLKYKNAYEGVAKVIQVDQEMFRSLLAAV